MIFPAEREKCTSRLVSRVGKTQRPVILLVCPLPLARTYCSSHVSAYRHAVIGWEEPPTLFWTASAMPASQPVTHVQPARMNDGAAPVGIRQGAHDFISSILNLEPPFPPSRPRRSAYGFRPDAVYLLPSLHPDCPSCPKSLTRSWRRSLLLGETTGLLPETPISTIPLCGSPRSRIGRQPWPPNVLAPTTQRRRFPQHGGPKGTL